MSEPLPVEDTTPEQPVAATPEPAAAPVAPDDLAEVDLKDEAKVKGLIGELARTRSELRTAKTQNEQLAQAWNSARPYVEFLQRNPAILQPRQEAPAEPVEDPDALELARDLDLYQPDGKPDVNKARRLLTLQDRRAHRAAQTAVQPLAQTNMTAAANANYQQLLQLRHSDGSNVRRETVDALWRKAAAEPNGMQVLAQPEALAGLALMVLGAEAASRKPTAPVPQRDPIFTEGSGGGGQAPSRMSELELKIAAQRGVSEKDWQARTKGYVPGKPTVLED